MTGMTVNKTYPAFKPKTASPLLAVVTLMFSVSILLSKVVKDDFNEVIINKSL